MPTPESLKQAIAALEAQRGIIDNAVIETSIAALRRQIALLEEEEAGEPTEAIGKTLLVATITSNHSTTDTSASGRILSALYALQVRLKAIATEHSATLDPRSGYDVIARFESDNPQQSAETAVQAALEMVAALQSQSVQYSSSGKMALFRVRVGIHSAPASDPADIAAGAQDSDAVLARRLQEAAPSNGILISYTTYQQVRGKFLVLHARPLEIAEVAEPLRVYHLTKVKTPTPSNPRDEVQGMAAAFIARVTELSILQSAFSQILTDSAPLVVSVMGDVGFGKSRLLNEYQKWLDLIPESLLLFSTQATPDMTYQPYSVFRALLANRFFIERGDSTVYAQEKLIQGLVAQLGESNLYRAHFIAHLAGFDFSSSPNIAGVLHDPQQIRDRAFSYFSQFLKALARQTGFPLVIMVEDIQWADAASLELIRYIVQDSFDLPLLVVTSAETSLFDIHPEWGEGIPTLKWLELAPFSDQAIRLLLAELLRNLDDPPRYMVETLTQHAAGNPFYVCEMIRLLLQMGVISSIDEAWTIDEERLEDVLSLRTLTEIAEARLMHLPPTEQAVLQKAAVAGTVFWDQLVQDLSFESGLDDLALRYALQNLTRRQILTLRPSSSIRGTTEYEFSSGIVRDLAYEKLSRQQRQIDHARIATWLIGHNTERLGQQAALIADHYRRAGEARRAIKWHTMAATQARNTFALDTATYHFQQALTLIGDDPASNAERIRLLQGLGAVLSLQKRFADAKEILDSTVQAAQDANLHLDLSRTLNQLAALYLHHADLPSALHAAEQAEQSLPDCENDTEAGLEYATALLWQSRTHLKLGNLDEAAQLANKVLQLSLSFNHKSSVPLACDVLGMIAVSQRRFEEAEVYFNRAIKWCQENGDYSYEVHVSHHLAELARQRGDAQTALVMSQSVEQLALEIGNRDCWMHAAVKSAEAWIGLSEFKTALKQLESLRPLIERGTLPELATKVACVQAEAQAHLGQLEAALINAQTALHLAKTHRHTTNLVEAWRVLGIVLGKTGIPIIVDEKSYTAVECFERALHLAGEGGDEHQQANVLHSWANIELESGIRAQGKQLWKSALDCYTRVGADYHVHRMKSTMPL